MFICYDLRGIQQYIFAVPHLKYIIGGSSLIDEFDRVIAPERTARIEGIQHVFSGGGRGAFRCSQAGAETLIKDIVSAAHERGLDIRIGMDEDLGVASGRSNQLYTCLTDDLDGEPCSASGLFPVAPEKGAGYRDTAKNVHLLIWRRVQAAREDRVGEEILRLIKEHVGLPEEFKRLDVSFMRNVSPDPDDDSNEQVMAGLGSAALGSRNRWAIIALDGNDMGSLHRQAAERFKDKQEGYADWLNKMSRALDDCTRKATAVAIGHAIVSWWATEDARKATGHGKVVLPFRPLLVGGDDILILSHCKWAMNVACSVCERFERFSAEADPDKTLWLGNDGRLTISAGILYASTSFPLASGIGYAESLLANAKKEGRKAKTQPSPAAIDWEHLTEGAVDTLTARRKRELRFIDGDIDSKPEVTLTKRPWLLRNLPELEKRKKQLEALPPSVVQELLPNLRRPLFDRCQFLARVKKNQPNLYSLIEEDPLNSHRGEAWLVEGTKKEPRRLVTDVIDAVTLLEEEQRMSKETAR